MMRVVCLAGMMAAIPFAHMLDLGYAASNMEPWAISALLGVAGALLGLITARTWVYGPVFALAFYWFADANVYDRGVLLAVPILAVMAAFAVLMRRIEEWALPMATVFAVLFSLSAILQSGPASLKWVGPEQTQVATGRPALVHLVLDEFMSPLAVPDTIPPGHPAAAMLDDLAAKGFAVTSAAKSVSDHTYESVSAVAGFTDSIDNFTKGGSASNSTYTVKDNALFARLKALGYGLTVIQTNFLDLCLGDEAIRCGSYTRAANMAVFSRHDIPVLTRLQLAFLALHQDYIQQKNRHRVAIYDEVVTGILEMDATYGYYSRPLVVLEMMDAIRDGQYVPAQGQALFAHLLLPHFPYVLAPDCSLKPVADWTYPVRHSGGQELSRIYQGYWDQVACVLSRVNQIVDATAARDDLVILMHGDHGSRISKGTEAEDDEDVLTSFVALRGPGIAAGRSDVPATLQDVLSRFYAGFLAD